MDYAKRITTLHYLRWACRGIVAATTGVSVWANQLSARPGTAPLVISIMPPILVMAGFELISRIPIPHDRAWLRRFGRPLATAGIVGIGAWLSYFHQRDAFLTYSGDPDTARLLPVAIDSLMVVAAISLIEVNLAMEETVARQAGLNVVSQKRDPIKVAAAQAPTGKERVALILAKQPDISNKELAIKAGVSVNYATTLAAQLRNRPQIVDAVEV
jgi:hypothetical protein